MIAKSMRQSSRQAINIHRNFGSTSRAYKITPVRWVKKRTWWQKLGDKVKSLFGR